ncbi:dnaJ homolog subfamily B member 13-like [Convolutriloba macropyga]|uniref:dnaJ homolog subfamily B member 13-like n=1 Tax=Convolutriloba macropyga TaxID=536237 RepID=UPI003F51EB38
MGVDYYNVLDTTHSATNEDIKRAYRKLALKFHPERNSEDGAVEKFRQIAEAYDVLSDNKKKAVFDQFGEEGLKQGVPHGDDHTEAWTHGYTFHGDPFKVFTEFFGGQNPFAEWYDRRDGELDMGFGGLHGRGRKQQDSPIERDLYLTLEEIYHGCIKKMKISRRVMNEDGHTSSIRDKILTITVKPGWKSGTKITFPKEGDQGPNTIPADIVFILKDKPHARFERVGSDLIYTATVQLGEALTGCNVSIQTLDNRELNIPINEIITHGYQKKVLNEGMKISNPKDSSKLYGDLFIKFNIVFPQSLTPEKKHLIKAALL